MPTKSTCHPARWFASISLTALLLVTPGPAQANSVVLAEEQVLKLFYQRNLDLISARFDVETAHAKEIIAAAIPNPVLSVDTYGVSPNNNAGFGPAVMARIDQLIETAGKRRLRKESSKLGSSASEQDLRDAIRVLSNGVRKAFYTLLLAQKTREIARDTLQRYEQIKQVNALRFQHGDISQSDLLRIEVEALKAQSELDNADANIESAQADLALLLAWPESAMQFTAKETWPEPMHVDQSAGVDALVNKALQQRPDLQAARTRADQAQKDLILARKLRIPDVTVGASYTRDPSNNELSTAGVGISLPIPIFYNQKGEIDQAVVNVNSTELEVQKLNRSVRTEVTRSLASWRSAEHVVARYRSDILKRMDNVRKAAELAYRQGATSILDLIDAQRTYRAVQLDYYTALHNRTLASADLAMALGEDGGSAGH